MSVDRDIWYLKLFSFSKVIGNILQLVILKESLQNKIHISDVSTFCTFKLLAKDICVYNIYKKKKKKILPILKRLYQ